MKTICKYASRYISTIEENMEAGYVQLEATGGRDMFYVNTDNSELMAQYYNWLNKRFLLGISSLVIFKYHVEEKDGVPYSIVDDIMLGGITIE